MVSIDKRQPAITINDWYRKRLGGVKTKTTQELEIKAANCWWGKLRANLQHPQVIVRMATWLAIISVGLGTIGLVLGVVSVWPKT